MKRFWGLGVIILLTACVNSDDFELPAVNEIEFNLDGQITGVAAVKNHFNVSTAQIYTFRNTGLYMEAFVISTDEGGNFYKELVLQDKAQNPTAGILLLIDDNSLHETFDFGRKIYVKLDGLSLGFNNGLIKLGIQNRGDVVAIPNYLIDEHIIRTPQKSEIVPLPLEINNFKPEFLNLFIELEAVQFNRNLVRENRVMSFAAENFDAYDGERQLESCKTGAFTTLSTSTYSRFRALSLPVGSGKVKGVLSRNFYDDFYIIELNSPEDLEFNGPRCDPDFLECNSGSGNASRLIFEENFEAIATVAGLASKGWLNLNVNGGNKKFEPGSFSANRYVRISGFNVTENPLEVWLISPEINLDQTSEATFSFDLMASYDNASILKVFITNDFTGDPKTTHWNELDAQIQPGPSNRYGSAYTRTELDISCIFGKVRIAFQYLGAPPDKTTTYDIDNIRLTGN